MKKKSFLTRTDLPLNSWRKPDFTLRLHYSFSGFKELREYTEDESHGITHIFIRVGLSLDGHILAGIFTIGIANLAVETNAGRSQSVHKYFHTQTGQFLGHSKKEAAEGLLRIGNNLYNQGNYAEAKEYFLNASKYSDGVLHPDQLFLEKSNQMEKLMEAEHSKQQELSPELSPELSIKEEIPEENNNQISKEEPLSKEEADFLYEQGLENFNQRKFSAATEAQLQIKEREFKNRQAEDLYNEGLSLYNKRQYPAAKALFQKALTTSMPDYKGRHQFEKMRTAAENSIRQEVEIQLQNETSEGCYTLGMGNLWRQEYSSAQRQFEDAFLKCTSDYARRPLFYEKQLEAEVSLRKEDQERWQNREAEELYNQGMSRLQGQDFSGAVHCFSQAYYKYSRNNYGRKQACLEQRLDAEREIEKEMRK